MPYPGLLHPELRGQATADPYLDRRHSDTVLAQPLWVGSAFCALRRSEQLRLPGAWGVHCPSRAVRLHHLPGPGAQFPRCAVCLLWRADLRLQPSCWMSTIQDLGKVWLAAGRLLTVWWKMPSLGLRL